MTLWKRDRGACSMRWHAVPPATLHQLSFACLDYWELHFSLFGLFSVIPQNLFRILSGRTKWFTLSEWCRSFLVHADINRVVVLESSSMWNQQVPCRLGLPLLLPVPIFLCEALPDGSCLHLFSRHFIAWVHDSHYKLPMTMIMCCWIICLKLGMFIGLFSS